MDAPVARIREAAPATDSFAASVLDGLRQTPKRIASKYFYDQTGSLLFDRICALPEYYQTRTEIALLQRHANEIAALMGADASILEFGAGALTKIRILLDAAHPKTYLPLDISGDYLRGVVEQLAADYPALTLTPIVADFTQPLALGGGERRCGFFPGGTIGNFRPEAAIALLKRMRGALNGGGLLIGVDLVKDPARLHAAYNDAQGVTALFNKNLLARINAELGADFDSSAFDHYAPYNAMAQRIEMYLVSARRQRVTVAGEMFDFAQGEPLHTEDSHKYTIESFRALAAQAGFRSRAVWTDPEQLFSMHWLEN